MSKLQLPPNCIAGTCRRCGTWTVTNLMVISLDDDQHYDWREYVVGRYYPTYLMQCSTCLNEAVFDLTAISSRESGTTNNDEVENNG